jgi:hypothetical protein
LSLSTGLLLSVEAILVLDHLATFDVALEQPKIHRPAVGGDSVVLVRLRPAQVMESYLRLSGLPLEHKSHARPLPVSMGADQLQLELRIGNASGDNRSPVVVWPEPELVRRTWGRCSR